MSISFQFSIRLKDDLPIAESILSQGRIRTYSDGILSLNSAEPTDHGSYVCIISTPSSASVRSRPAVITVKCKCRFGLYRKSYQRRMHDRSTNSFPYSPNAKSHAYPWFTGTKSVSARCLPTDWIRVLVSQRTSDSYRTEGSVSLNVNGMLCINLSVLW